MADPKYPVSKEGFADAAARMDAQNEQIAKDQAKREQKLQQETRRSGQETGRNVEARKAQVDVAANQSEAISAVTAALERETATLLANTRAWEAQARARATATGASQASIAGVAAAAQGGLYAPTTVGFGDSPARLDAQTRAAAAEARGKLSSYSVIAAEQANQRLAATAAQAELSRTLGSPAAAQALARTPGLSSYFNPYTRIGPSALPLSAAPSARTFIAGPGGLPSQAAARFDAFGTPAEVGQLTSAEKALEAQHNRIKASIAGVAQEQRAANLAFRESVAEVSASSQALTRHGALSTEFIQSFVRGEVTLKEFGNSLVSTIGKFGGWAVAGGLVYGAFAALKRLTEGLRETQSGVDQLERAIPDVNRKQAEEGFRKVSAEVNVPIKDVAQAQFFAARAGFHGQQESLEAGTIGVEALKLDEVPVQDATKALGAIRIAFGLTIEEVRKTFHELNTGQLEFNARLSQTLPQLGRAASAYANAGGKVTGLTRELISVVGVTGGGGGTGGGNPATFFIREPSNIARPNAITGLRNLGLDPIAGQTNIEKFNEEIRKKVAEGKYSEDQIREIAKFVGGGGGQGGRYGIANIISGRSGRQGEIDKELAATPAAGHAEDLNKKLGQLDEKFKSFGTEFERIGSLIGKAGVTFAIEQVVNLLHSVGEGFEFIAKPLDTLGNSINTFSKIPVAPEALTALALVKGGSRLAGSVRGGGLLSPLSEVPGLGFVDSEANKQLRGLKSTVALGLVDNERELASESNNLRRARRAQVQAANKLVAFEAENAAGRAAFENPATRSSELAQAYAAEQAALADDVAATRQRAEAVRLSVSTLQEEQLALKSEAAVYAGAGTAQQRVQRGVDQFGAVVGRKNEPLLAERGLVGTQREAELAAAGTTAAAQAEYAATIDRGTVEYKDAAISTSEALTAAGAQIREGGSIILGAFATAAAEIRAGGAVGGVAGGLAGGLSEGGLLAGAGAGAGLGALAGKLGGGLIKGLGIAFIGSAVAELAGNAIGGGLGKTIGSVGGTAALGAGIGSIFGPPGTVIGGVLGAGAGLLLGSGGSGNTSAEDRIKKQHEAIVAQQHKLEAGIQTGGSTDLEFAAESYAETLEEAFSGEGEKAAKAKSIIEKANKSAEANLKLFGQGTPGGAEAENTLLSNLQGAIKDFLRNPSTGDQSAEVISKAQTDLIGQAKEQASAGFKSARSPEEVKAAAQKALNSYQRIYEQSVGATQTGLQTQIAAQQQLGLRAERELLVLQNTPQAQGKGAGKLRREHIDKLKEVISKSGQEVDNLTKQLKTLKELTGLNKPLTEAQEATLGEAFSRTTELQAPSNALELAKAGADPARKRAIEQRQRQKRLSEGEELFKNAPNELRKLRDETETAEIESRQAGVREAGERPDRAANRAIAKLPIGTPQETIDKIKTHAAEQKLRFEKLHKQAFSNKEIEEAEVAVLEARKTAETTALSEATAKITTEGQIAQARDQGNSLGQAQDAASTAARLQSLAKSAPEKLQALLGVIQAGNQLQQALEQHIADVGSLEESREVNPLEKARTRVLTDRRELGAARGPDERIKDQAKLNNDQRALRDAQVSERESETAFQLEMHEISTQQAIKQYNDLLKIHGLATQTRRDLRSKIRSLQGELGNNPVYDLSPTSIKLPTAFDVHKAILSAGGGAGIIHNTGDTTQVNNFTITVHDGKDVGKVADVLDRALGTKTHAKLRATGLRGT